MSALLSLGVSDRIPDLVRALNSSEYPRAQSHAARRLAFIARGSKDDEEVTGKIISELAAAYDGKKWPVREAIIFAIGEIAQNCPHEKVIKNALSILTEKTRDRTVVVADSATDVLKSLGVSPGAKPGKIQPPGGGSPYARAPQKPIRKC